MRKALQAAVNNQALIITHLLLSLAPPLFGIKWGFLDVMVSKNNKETNIRFYIYKQDFLTLVLLLPKNLILKFSKNMDRNDWDDLEDPMIIEESSIDSGYFSDQD